MGRNDDEHQPIQADLLDRPIAFQRCFVTLTGSVNAALMLSQAVYWSHRTTNPEKWFYKTADEWEEETGLSRREQDTARSKLRDYLETKLAGVPARLHYRVNWQAINEQILHPASAYNERRRACKTSFDKSAKLDSTKAPNKVQQNRQTIPESTTETTSHLPLAGIDPPSTKRRPGGEADVVAYCMAIGLTGDDGVYYWSKWQGNGFRNGGHDIKDWRETIRSAKAAGYAPSQRNRGTRRYETTTSERPEANRARHREHHAPGGGGGEEGGIPNL